MQKVSIVRCNDYQIDKVKTAVSHSFDHLGGLQQFVSPGSKVVLKANLLMEKKPVDAATTHPILVQAVAELVREAGGRATIIDSPGGPYTESVLKRIYSVCGMEEAARKSGAELNFDLGSVEIENPKGKYLKKLTVLKPLVDADVIINLPKLKTHGQMAYTGAVKNMFGAIPGLQKPEYHMRMPGYEDFADALIDIFLSVKPRLNVMDAVIGMDGAGPSAGTPKPIGLIISSEDGFTLDFAALSVIGVNPLDIPLLKQASLRELTPKEINELAWVGEPLNEVMVSGFKMPQLDTLKTLYFFDKGPLKTAMDLMRPKPAFDKSKCIGCADCAKSCPVHIIKMKDKRPEPDLTKCIRCFCCQELCPAKAVTIKRNKAGEFLMNKGVPVFIDLMNRFQKPGK